MLGVDVRAEESNLVAVREFLEDLPHLWAGFAACLLAPGSADLVLAVLRAQKEYNKAIHSSERPVLEDGRLSRDLVSFLRKTSRLPQPPRWADLLATASLFGEPVDKQEFYETAARARADLLGAGALTCRSLVVVSLLECRYGLGVSEMFGRTVQPVLSQAEDARERATCVLFGLWELVKFLGEVDVARACYAPALSDGDCPVVEDVCES